MIGMTGHVAQNSAPPGVVMLALGAAQSGLLIAIAPWVTRRLRASTLKGVCVVMTNP